MAYKGVFRPKNRSKYVAGKGIRHDGMPNDVDHIVYRSRWELVVMQRFDNHPDILEWSCEPFSILYADPTRPKRPKNYWPDFWVKKKNRDGSSSILVIEVKPDAQTKLPQKGKKRTRRYVVESLTYARNVGKWAAAERFCAQRGWKFLIWTERDLGL